MQSFDLSLVGIALIFLGFGALLFSSLASSGDSKVKAGGILLIGPIPIIFGNDKNAVVFAIAGAIVLMLAAYLFYFKR